jgi:opacity protein-like surface antigen
MKKFLTLCLALATSTLFAGGYTEQEPEITGKTGFYIGGFGQQNLYGGTADNSQGLGLVVGYEYGLLGPINVGAEGRVSKTNTYNDNIVSYTGLVKAGLEIGNIEPYALGGYQLSDTSFGSDNNAFVYGGGISADVNCRTKVFADYLVNADLKEGGDKISHDTVTIGIKYLF